MTLQSVPDHQELTGNMTQQVVKKLDDLGTADAAPKQSKVEAPPSYPRHGGQCFPIEVVLQHGCLAPWSPRTAAVRALTQSTFVDEDDSPIFVFGFFFNSGQRSRFQRLIFSSSRSKARPVGPLAAPTQMPQNAPGLGRVVLHSTFLLDQVGHTR